MLRHKQKLVTKNLLVGLVDMAIRGLSCKGVIGAGILKRLVTLKADKRQSVKRLNTLLTWFMPSPVLAGTLSLSW